MDVIMPQLGETVAEGTVIKWYKQVGDAVRADETLFDVETDKVNTEIPAPAAGILAEIVVPEGVTAKVGARLAVIRVAGEEAVPSRSSGARAEEGRASEARPGPAAPFSAPVAAAASSGVAGAAAAPSSREFARGDQLLSPVVRRLSAELGIDPSRITGTGPGGRVTREDVLAYASAVKQPASSKPLSNVRRRTAEHMTRAWTTVPHVVQVVEVDFTAIAALRREHGAAWQSGQGFSLTYLPFIAKAASIALAKFPDLNAVFEGESLRLNERVNLGIAVDLKLEGLVVPVLKDCQSKSLRQLARAIEDLSRRARAGQLVPDDMSEGTYTITNNGAFGTVITAPIINAPQVAILSVDAIRKKPVVVEAPEGDRIVIAPVGVLAQSFDHRAVDGAYSASFLTAVKSLLETRSWREELEA